MTNTFAGIEPRSRRGWSGIAMVVVGAVLAIGAIPIVVVGFQQRSEAGDARAQAAHASAALPGVSKRLRSYEQRRAKLEPLVKAFPPKVSGVKAATTDQTEAQRQFFDMVSRVAPTHNSGDGAGAVAIWRTDGQAAIDALTQKNDATKQAIKVAQGALHELQAAVG